MPSEKKRPLAILAREELAEYDFGSGHPFRGDRYRVFPRYLEEHLDPSEYDLIAAEWATDDDLLRICKKEYIDFTRGYYGASGSNPADFYRFQSVDNRPIGPSGKIEEAARLIVGQAKLAVDLVQSGAYTTAISIGGGMHHAREGYGEGFCLYNDVAFAGRYLSDRYQLERVLILDTDAHAGNGTCEYFYQDPRVLFIDMHQDPMTLYPGSGFVHEIGRGDGKGFTVNIPLPPHAGYNSYELIFDELVFPLVEEFRPRAIIRNGGSDPHIGDGLTQLGLPVRGFRMIGEKVKELRKMSNAGVIDLIASGYNRDVLCRAWLAIISGLAGIRSEIEAEDSEPKVDPAFSSTREVLSRVKAHLADYWRSMSQ